ncbi:hypothetical protein [Streptomyces sp. ME109]|nr:hypothetical protein [Streptomyces sp. me109]
MVKRQGKVKPQRMVKRLGKEKPRGTVKGRGGAAVSAGEVRAMGRAVPG